MTCVFGSGGAADGVDDRQRVGRRGIAAPGHVAVGPHQDGPALVGKGRAGVVAVRRAGAYHAFSSLNAFFLIGEMVVPGSSYWNIGRGREPGEVAGDEEGMKTMRDLGRNVAWLLKKLAG